jgi:predicted acyltransferase
VPAFVAAMKFPVIKKVWSSSFVLVTSGWAAILLAAFYLVVDVLRLRIWALPFIWIGMNAIALYVVEHLFEFPKLALLFVGGPVAKSLGAWSTPVTAAVAMLFVLLLARFLYKRQVFLRV